MTRWFCHGAACTYALRPTDIVTRKSAFTALLGSPVRSGGPFYLSLKLAPAARPLLCENIRRGFVCQNKTNNAPDRPTRVRGPRCNVIEPRVIEPRAIEPRAIEPRVPDQQPRFRRSGKRPRVAARAASCVLRSNCPVDLSPNCPGDSAGAPEYRVIFYSFPAIFRGFRPAGGGFLHEGLGHVFDK